MMQVDWRTVRDHRDPKFMVKGYVLAVADYPGSQYRFLVEEVRAMNADRSMGIQYRIRDAHTVSDAELLTGKRSEVVATVDTWVEVEAYCDPKIIDA